MLEFFLGLLIGFWTGVFITCCIIAARDERSDNDG